MNLFLIILISASIIIMVTLVVLEIFLGIAFKRLISIVNEQSRVIYVMDKHIKRLTANVTETNDTIMSLSTSVETIMHKSTKKPVYPEPDLVDKITKTVVDLITMEIALSKDMRYPPRESTNMIIESVLKTYPNVDKDYLIKKTLSMIESYAKS